MFPALTSLGLSGSSAAQGAGGTASQDNSGWTVATGGSKATGGFSLPWYAWLVIGVGVAVVYKGRK